MSVAAGARRPWLVGPAPDLLLGCGVGYLLLVAVLAAVRPDMARLQPFLPLIILLSGVPHYGATLVRVYGTAEARRHYAQFAFHLSALVWGAFAAAAFQPRLGSLLITLYLSWSAWHYAGQNYGLTSMFLGRAGIQLPPAGRRLLRASFALSVALTLLNFHRVLGVGSADPMFDASGAYHFVRLGIPEAAARVLFPLLAGGYLVALAASAWLLRGCRVRALAPAAVLVLTHALWFAVPAVVGHLAPGVLEAIGAPAAFVWIAVAHSAQYLWVSHHFARAAGGGPAAGGAWWGARVLLAGAAVWVLPALAFAPGAFGHVPFEAGLGLLVAAAVNLHHFVLDGAIWKLRDPRVGRVLVAGERASGEPVPSSTRPPALAAITFVAAGALSIACWVGVAWEKEMGQRRAVAASDLGRARLAADRLRFFGRDGPRIRNAIGRLEERAGRPEAALAEYRRSLALLPSPTAWAGIGRIAQERGDLASARQAYSAALALDPGRPGLQRRLDQLRAALAAAPAHAPATSPAAVDVY